MAHRCAGKFGTGLPGLFCHHFEHQNLATAVKQDTDQLNLIKSIFAVLEVYLYVGGSYNARAIKCGLDATGLPFLTFQIPLESSFLFPLGYLL